MKDTILSEKMTLNCGGKLLSLDTPIVMGIVNVTPDSFYDGGRNNSLSDVICKCEEHLRGGAQILDIGGFSTRPGATEITPEEELNRVIPILKEISRLFPEVVISIDSFRSSVAAAAVDHGAHIINDVSGGQLDNQMFATAGKLGTPYILMHMQNTPKDMQKAPYYENILQDLTLYFSERIKRLKDFGVKDILLDVGFGFGKTLEHNYKLLANLDHFWLLGCPILVGISRKSMLYKPLNSSAEHVLNATTAAHIMALEKGGKVLRVHDCKEASEAIKIWQLVKNQKR